MSSTRYYHNNHRRQILPKNNTSDSHAKRNDSNQNGTHNSHSSSQNIGTNEDSFLSNHTLDVPNISLMLSDINNSKQFESGDHSVDKICTSVLKKNDDETTNITNGSAIREDEFLNSFKTKLNVRGLSTICESEIIVSAHSTPKENHSDNIDYPDIQVQKIPLLIRGRIALVFRCYRDIMSLVLFEFIYIKLFHTIEPEYFCLEFFKNFDQIFEVRDNIIHKKIQFRDLNKLHSREKKLYSKTFLSEQDDIISSVSSIIKQQIVLNISPIFIKPGTKSIMCVVSEVYDPSLFFVQKCSEKEKLNYLMIKMQNYYDAENTKYSVLPTQILAGSYYCYFYSECENENKWRRVKILCHINSTLVQVFQVDFGIVDYILKTNLRFLKKEFCYVSCQAIHCCLTSFNTIGTIARNVTDAFFNIISNNVIIKANIDENFYSNSQNQSLHVTLFHKDKNINLELLKYHI